MTTKKIWTKPTLEITLIRSAKFYFAKTGPAADGGSAKGKIVVS
jgi:hypothetical protein